MDGLLTKRKTPSKPTTSSNKRSSTSLHSSSNSDREDTLQQQQPKVTKRSSPRLKAKNSNVDLGSGVCGTGIKVSVAGGDADGQFDHFNHGRAQASHYDHIEEEFGEGLVGEEEDEDEEIIDDTTFYSNPQLSSSSSALLPSSTRKDGDTQMEDDGKFNKSERFLLSSVFATLALILIVGLTCIHAFL